MALQSYSDLRAEIADWLGDASLFDKAPTFIRLAEDELRTDLVMPEMEVTYTANTSGSFSLPSDFDSLRAIALNGTTPQSLKQISLTAFYDMYRADGGNGGPPSYFAIDAGQVFLWPTPASFSAFTVAYRAKLPSLSDAVPTNWALAQYPTLYLYTCLLHAEARGWNVERLPLIQAYVEDRKAKINAAGQRKRYGGRLVASPPVVENVGRTRYAFKW